MKILTIIGPTAVGKTNISIKIARKISGEIISADSRQIYKYLNIGTAKPTLEQKQIATFHLIDFVDPNTNYSCGQFARDAETLIEEIMGQDKVPIICGGTGLYIKALFHPLHALPESKREIKEKFQNSLKKLGVDHLYKKLLLIDPELAERITPKDKQRIIRGLEVYEMTGTPLSLLLKTERKKAKYAPCYIGLSLPRRELYQSINERFAAMIKQGLVNEVKRLLKRGLDPTASAMRTIGYKEIIEYLQGYMSFEETIEKVKRRTRNFAKRQLTWFNKIPGLQWFNPVDPDIVKYIIDQWKANGSAGKE